MSTTLNLPISGTALAAGTTEEVAAGSVLQPDMLLQLTGAVTADRVGIEAATALTFGTDADWVNICQLSSSQPRFTLHGPVRYLRTRRLAGSGGSPSCDLVYETAPTSSVNTSRSIVAGAGLTGGGDLSADRTLDVVADADASIVVAANSLKVGVLATDAQHGARGGGTQHLAATTSVAGFMSSADKTKLDKVAVGSAARAGAGAADITKRASFLTPDAAGNVVTVADGTVDGQLLTLFGTGSYGGGKTSVITPAHFQDGTTATIAAQYSYVTLMWVVANTKWQLVELAGTVTVA